MYRLNYLKKDSLEYKHFHDYILKRIMQKQINGLLKFLKIPYNVDKLIISEIASRTPQLHRLDFAGETTDGICLILECQSRLPTDDDVKRFFQYVTSLNSIKNKKVEIYILCTEKAPYSKREYTLKDGCIYEMNVISLKNFKAKDIINNIQHKIKHEEYITEEDIASIQLIAYTDYNEPLEKILINAYKLIEKLNIDANEKEAMLQIFNILCANMLDDDERREFMKETENMMLNPRDEYFHDEGKKEGKIEGKIEGKKEGKKEAEINLAQKMLKHDIPLNDIIKITGLTKSQILNSK